MMINDSLIGCGVESGTYVDTVPTAGSLPTATSLKHLQYHHIIITVIWSLSPLLSKLYIW